MPIRIFPAILLAVAIASASASAMDRVAIDKKSHGFVLAPSGKPFTPWGLNYGNRGRLIEDFWETDWATVEKDFAAMKALGANVVRVHLQFGKFMDAADRPNEKSFDQIAKLLDLAEKTGLYLDLTGLACYRKADVPAWYDALDDAGRWAAQSRFWEAVAGRCAKSPAVFCYDLMNEPIVPGERRKAGDWYSGKPFGGYDFIQFIALDPAGRTRDETCRQWVRAMTGAIRGRDAGHLITVGMLPWVPQWGYLSGFVPEKMGPELDFISVHIYPEKGKVDEAIANLKGFAVGKPVVIEETFPLSCGREDLQDFIRRSREYAAGWMGHYDGLSRSDLEKLRDAGTITMSQALMLDWLKLFQELDPNR